MNSEKKYELPIYSSALEEDPIIISKNMDMNIKLNGYDDKNRLKKIMICFKAVICYKYTSARFSTKLHDSYDRIVELTDSEWLEELMEINKEDYNYWKPKHYLLYLDEVGLFQFIAQDYEVIGDE